MKKTWKEDSVKKLIETYHIDYGDNPVEIIREKSRNLVLDAFSKGWAGPPYNIMELAKLSGIHISPNVNVLDGRITPKGKKFEIEYNPNRSVSRINFSIAHEIGHTFFPDCAEKVRNRVPRESIDEDSELEFLCNVAASELLLPYAEFSREVSKLPLNLGSIKKLAERYSASLEAVLLRYVEVSQMECAFIMANYEVSGNLVIEYSKSSKALDFNVSNKTKIAKDSIAYHCLRPGTEKFSSSEKDEEIFDGRRFSVFAIGLGALKRSQLPRVGMFLVPREKADLPEQMIVSVNGDATKPLGNGNKIIAQVVNTSGGVGMGFGRAMAKVYPESKSNLQSWKLNRSEFKLGNISLFQVNSDTWVCQLLAQQGIHKTATSIPLKYWALRECLLKLKDEAVHLNASVHMPAIGAGQAGGDWDVIEGMVYSELVSNGVYVKVYFLHGKNTLPKKEATLSLFDEDSL